MSLRDAIHRHLEGNPEARARFEEQQRQGMLAAQKRPGLFIDSDAYAIPDIPVRIDGVVLWAAGDISLRDFAAVSEGRITELDLALKLFQKNHPDLPAELLQENLGTVRMLRITTDVMQRISGAQVDAQQAGQAAFDGQGDGGGGFIIRPQGEDEPAPPPPFADQGAGANGSA